MNSTVLVPNSWRSHLRKEPKGMVSSVNAVRLLILFFIYILPTSVQKFVKLTMVLSKPRINVIASRCLVRDSTQSI